MGFDILKATNNDPFFPDPINGMMIVDVFNRPDLVDPDNRQLTDAVMEWMAINAPKTKFAVRTSWNVLTMKADPARVVFLFETNEEALHFKLRWQDQTS